MSRPFEINHTEQDMKELTTMLLRLDDEIRVVLETTGIYHLPVLSYFPDKGIFVAVINPYEIKNTAVRDLDGQKQTGRLQSQLPTMELTIGTA